MSSHYLVVKNFAEKRSQQFIDARSLYKSKSSTVASPGDHFSTSLSSARGAYCRSVTGVAPFCERFGVRSFYGRKCYDDGYRMRSATAVNGL